MNRYRKMVEIVLPIFNSSLTPVTATTIDNAVSEGTVEIEVNLEDFRNTFKLRSGQEISPLSDNVPTTNEYYVDVSMNVSTYSIFASDAKEQLNPAFGRVVLNPATVVDASGNALTPAQMALVNDYVRDLSSQLFGSPHLTYLITNNKAVQDDLVEKFKNVVMSNIKNILLKVSVTNTSNNNLSGSVPKYSTDQPTNATGAQLTMNADNVCRQIMLSILQQEPDRFIGTSYVSVAPLPLQEDDSILFRVILDNSNQNSPVPGSGIKNVGWSVAGQVRNRVYNIRLIMKAEPSNPGIDVLTASGSTYYDNI